MVIQQTYKKEEEDEPKTHSDTVKDSIELLIEHGAQVNAGNAAGLTPLSFASLAVVAEPLLQGSMQGGSFLL